jgi:hypothetical protein
MEISWGAAALQAERIEMSNKVLGARIRKGFMASPYCNRYGDPDNRTIKASNLFPYVFNFKGNFTTTISHSKK